MLICEGCGKAWHMWCITPQLKVAPRGTWVCQACQDSGYEAQIAGGSSGDYKPPPTVAARLRDERGQQLHGKRIQKEFEVGPGVMEVHEGMVAFEPAEQPPYRFRIRYDDGDEEMMFEAEVRRYLKPAAVQSEVVRGRTRSQTAHVAASLALRVAGSMRNAEAELPLSDMRVLGELVNELLPGCSQRSVTNLHKAMLMMQQPRSLPCAVTAPGALEQLTEHVDMDEVEWILDPFAGTKAVAEHFKGRGARVISNDLNPAHGAELAMNACQPAFWQHMAKQGLEAVVCSPWFDCLDLVVPLMVGAAAKVVCVHVSYSFYATMPRARAVLLKQWMDAGRVVVIGNLPRVGRQPTDVFGCTLSFCGDVSDIATEAVDAGGTVPCPGQRDSCRGA
ncbi:hypothetical protein RI054_28g117120 [Pseudoscourfieldia marina]